MLSATWREWEFEVKITDSSLTDKWLDKIAPQIAELFRVDNPVIGMLPINAASQTRVKWWFMRRVADVTS